MCAVILDVCALIKIFYFNHQIYDGFYNSGFSITKVS